MVEPNGLTAAGTSCGRRETVQSWERSGWRVVARRAAVLLKERRMPREAPGRNMVTLAVLKLWGGGQGWAKDLKRGCLRRR